MRFNIISNLTNGVGLQQDFLLLKKALEDRGHTVAGVQFNQKPLVIQRADVNIFLEVVTPEAFPAAPQQWAVPNPEWWFAGWDAYRWDKVLAKTWDCQRIFTGKVGDRCQYLGWVARDLYVPTMKRDRRFLHIAGKSRFKNTSAVIAAARISGLPVTVIGEPRRVTDVQLRHLMNTHFCHVMPSAYEGYGQVLHEAQGVGQVIITTNAPPMNEIRPALLVPSTGTRPHHSGLLHAVEASAIARAMQEVCAMTPYTVEKLKEDARLQFQKDTERFNVALDALVGGRA